MKVVLYLILLFASSLTAFCQDGFFNQPPEIDPIPNYGPVDENSGTHQIILTGISSGAYEGNNGQIVEITASSNNPNLIFNLNVKYDQSDVAFLYFTLVKDANGKATITVTLDDGQIWRSTTIVDFDVNVTAINGQPFFELASEKVIVNENDGKIEISDFAQNIDDGDPELDQKLSFTTSIVTSDETLTFRTNPKIDKNGILKFEANLNAYGQAEVSVVLKDDGGTKNGGIDTSDESSFIIQVININSPPTINDIPFPVTILEDAGEQTIELTGISSGINENQDLEFIVEPENAQLIKSPVIEYEQGNDRANLKFYLGLNQFGETQIKVIVDDGQSENNRDSCQIMLVVQPVADTPSITPASTIPGVQTVSGLVIRRNSADGEEVSHYKISNIQNGTLYQNDGISMISENQFITHQQGNSGLKFTPAYDLLENGSFSIEAATANVESALGGDIVQALISVKNDPPVIVSVPDTNALILEKYTYKVEANDPDQNDVLSFSFTFPELMKPWFSAVDNKDGTATLTGTPPIGSDGIYNIQVVVKDRFEKSDSQSFNLTIHKLNSPPTLSSFEVNIQEDDTLFLNSDTFEPWYNDEDGDLMQFFRVVSEPLYGSLFLNGIELSVDDEFTMNANQSFIYIPNRNYYGLDVFDWNVSDGTVFSEMPERLNILISSVNDPPEIVNFEDRTSVYTYGDERISITESGIVVDEDSDKLIGAEIGITLNYQQGEDVFSIKSLEELNYEWNDSTGILSIKGLADLYVYQQALRSLEYMNLNSLSPSESSREIDIVLYDSDTVSQIYKRRIEFENAFLELAIPTGFTPNSDGVNDTWNMETLNGYQEVMVEVYSRSGNKIFSSVNNLLEWDGTFNGNYVPPGTYYYFISVSKFKKVFKGTVTVLR